MDTVYVDAGASGPGIGSPEAPFQRIATGLFWAASGATVYVAAGDYSENLVISRPVTLLGAGAGVTRILADVTRKGIEINADHAEVRGFSIVGVGDPDPENYFVGGIWAEDVDSLTIRNNVVAPYYGLGIALADCTGVLIEDNVVNEIADLPAYPGDSMGINLHEVDGLIQDNTSSGNSIGVWVSGHKEGEFELSVVGSHIQDNTHGGLVFLDATRIVDLSENMILNNGGPGITSLDVGRYLACQIAGGVNCEPPTTEISYCSNNIVVGNNPDFGYGFSLVPGCLSPP
jgi:hypothetical protein